MGKYYESYDEFKRFIRDVTMGKKEGYGLQWFKDNAEKLWDDNEITLAQYDELMKMIKMI